MTRSLLCIAATGAISVTLHLTLGWEWTVLAGVTAGLWRPGRGWALGAIGGALGWGALIGYTASVAPGPLRLLLDTLGALGGNIPGEAVVGATLVLGAVLGAVGGGLGTLLNPSLPLISSGEPIP